MYSPTLGRFLQTDPIGYKDQFNLYAYVGNDPVNGVDPTGMYECASSGEFANDHCASLDDAVTHLNELVEDPDTSSEDAKVIQGVLSYLGPKGEPNSDGVMVIVEVMPDEEYDEAGVDSSTGNIFLSPDVLVNVNRGARNLAHEVPHHERFQTRGGPPKVGSDRLNEETASYMTENAVRRAQGVSELDTAKAATRSFAKSCARIPQDRSCN